MNKHMNESYVSKVFSEQREGDRKVQGKGFVEGDTGADLVEPWCKGRQGDVVPLRRVNSVARQGNKCLELKEYVLIK